MTTADRDPMFDQRIADWLEGDPNNAPVTVLETLADTMPVTRQRRATLPLPPIGRVSAPLRLALVAAIVVALVGGAMLFAGRTLGRGRRRSCRTLLRRRGQAIAGIEDSSQRANRVMQPGSSGTDGDPQC